MPTYALILNKIDMIRNDNDLDGEAMCLVIFLSNSKQVKEFIKDNHLQTLTLSKIKTSKIYFNIENCRNYIKDKTTKSNLAITLMIERYVKINIVENKHDAAFLKEGFKVTPLHFNQVK